MAGCVSRRRLNGRFKIARGPPGSSSSPTGAIQVQVFGRRDSRDTQKALRFFKERRVDVAYVDLANKPIARGELRRFADRLKTMTLVDTAARAYQDAGLGYMRLDESDLFERLLADQRLLRLPLVRSGQDVTVGVDEASWKAWLNR